MTTGARIHVFLEDGAALTSQLDKALRSLSSSTILMNRLLAVLAAAPGSLHPLDPAVLTKRERLK